MSDFSLASQGRAPFVWVPEPQNIGYELHEVTPPTTPKTFRIQQQPNPSTQDEICHPGNQELLHPTLRVVDLILDSANTPPDNNNSAWARAKRSPVAQILWDARSAPSVGNIWLVLYAILTVRPELEIFRVRLNGTSSNTLSLQLQAAGLAIPHPDPSAPPGEPVPSTDDHIGQLVITRCSFWQGAGSPFGTRPVWVAGSTLPSEPSFPPQALDYTLTTRFPSARIHISHPVRPLKPTPGATIYQRWIPHLKESFSMVALDWENEEHLNYFHTWQNDPRVAAGWNETGTLDQHREYLQKMSKDLHQFPVLAKFDNTFFAYFEIYWAKEDAIGAYYNAGDYDRGRHFLVGDARFRGPHRVKAWHTSLTHYMFLDDPRTNLVLGEPRATGTKVLAYDQANGYHIEKLIDLPHKRAALIMCPRERFFQQLPFEYDPSK